MENALWKDKRLLAYEVSKDYFTEKEIREASHRGELRCPDPDCQSPILKYCHGEIREPYFAHRDNAQCDYIKYEKSSGIFHGLRLRLYEHFSACGYDVQMEVKVLKHHYSHLLFEWDEGGKTALELGTKATILNNVENINAEYGERNISVNWLVVDEPKKSIKEDHTYFLKRFCLNESANNSLFVLGYDAKRVTGYKEDPKHYVIDGRKVDMPDYPQMFSYETDLYDLYFEEGVLTLRGFQEEYEAYVEKRRLAFEGYMEKEAYYGGKTSNNDYESRRLSILPDMDQQEHQVRDVIESRLITCVCCGEIKEETEFASYGRHIKRGRCKACRRK